jgi:ATP-dependent Clp protease ATP-binding subunit ClpC
VFERFTERARQVVVLAQEEARVLRHNYIGTEHLLLGLLREEEGLAARVLESLDVALEEVRWQVARVIGQGDEVTAGEIPFTPRSKKVLELSLQEAFHLGHNNIGTEHILLGLARENQGVAARVLFDFGADAETIRDAVLRMLSGPRAPIEGEVQTTGRRSEWEYRIVDSDVVSLSEEELNRLGAEGWELAGVPNAETVVRLIFKRRGRPG